MKFFPEHWNGWQKGAVIAVVIGIIYYALTSVSLEVKTEPVENAGAASDTYRVVYLVRTSYAQVADVTYNNATEGMERRRDMKLSGVKAARWEYTMPKGTHAYITVSASSTISGKVSTSCELLVNDERVEFTEAKGPNSSVTCSTIVGR